MWKTAGMFRNLCGAGAPFSLWFVGLLAISAGCVSLNGQTRTLAYVTNDSGGSGQGTLSVIDTVTNSVVATIADGGTSPFAVAITPNGTRAYVTNFDSDSVSVIDTATNTTIGAPITVGGRPRSVAITPDGTRAYIVNFGGGIGPGGGARGISIVDVVSNTVNGPPIDLGPFNFNIAITPDGTRAYVTCACGGGTFGVAVLDTSTNTVVGPPIPVPFSYSVAFTPDGTRAYVTGAVNNGTVDVVFVINTATNTIIGTPIPLPASGTAVAITPDGSRAYVAAVSTSVFAVIAIDTATNLVVGSPIPVGNEPEGVAISPDGARAFVTNMQSDSVSVIDTATNTVLGPPTAVGKQPFGIAIAKVCSAPTVTALAASPDILWPPNHKMIPVSVSGSTSGGCGAVSCKIIAVSSNEPVDSDGDWIITGNLILELEADRLGHGSGRVYTVTVQCTDVDGNTATKSTFVTVPHDQRR